MAADAEKLTKLRGEADYAAQGELLPKVLPELHAVYVRRPEERDHALMALIQTYHSANGEDEPVTLRSGALAVVAATALRESEDELVATLVPAGDGASTPDLFPQSFAARRTSGGMEAHEAHLFPIPDPAAGVPAELRAYCGASIWPGEAELLSTVFTGAPCMGCLVRVPSDTTP